MTPQHGLGGMLFQPLAVEEYQNENTPSEREKMLQSLLTTRINRGKELLDTLLENSDVCAEDVHCERHRGIGSSLQYEIQRITNPGWVTWLYKNPFLGTAVFLLIVWILWCLIRCVVTFLMRCGDSLNKSQADLTLLGLLSILHSNMDRSFNPFYKSRTKNEDSNKKDIQLMNLASKIANANKEIKLLKKTFNHRVNARFNRIEECLDISKGYVQFLDQNEDSDSDTLVSEHSFIRNHARLPLTKPVSKLSALGRHISTPALIQSCWRARDERCKDKQGPETYSDYKENLDTCMNSLPLDFEGDLATCSTPFLDTTTVPTL